MPHYYPWEQCWHPIEKNEQKWCSENFSPSFRLYFSNTWYVIKTLKKCRVFLKWFFFIWKNSVWWTSTVKIHECEKKLINLTLIGNLIVKKYLKCLVIIICYLNPCTVKDIKVWVVTDSLHAAHLCGFKDSFYNLNIRKWP